MKTKSEKIKSGMTEFGKTSVQRPTTLEKAKSSKNESRQDREMQRLSYWQTKLGADRITSRLTYK